MARYRKIVNLIAKDISTNRLAGNNLISPVSLAFLWEKATTKKCLLDFILEFEAASGQSVLLPQYDALRIEGSDMQRDWLQMKFHNNEITSDILKQATHVVFGNTGTGNMSVGEAIEIISASYAMESSFKPPIKLGRYAYLDGKPRPDCVEIVVREIIDTLIYGKILLLPTYLLLLLLLYTIYYTAVVLTLFTHCIMYNLNSSYIILYCCYCTRLEG